QRVQLLAADGSFIRQFGRTGSKGITAGLFNYPTDVALLPDRSLVVADAYNDRIQVFASDGRFVRKWGGLLAMNISGSRPGWFKTATGVSVGPKGHVFVADFYNNRIQEFTGSGTFLAVLAGKEGGSGRLKLPTDCAVDDAGNVYVVDFGNNRIVKFSPD
ncbi:MAG TPA: 6-bladed beta-propeller, partial [Desulfobulbus sp.]|nr:6-bladed beta-propeller [Desulfobulbus sp.]